MSGNIGDQIDNKVEADKPDALGVKDGERQSYADASGSSGLVSTPDSHPGVGPSGDRESHPVPPRQIVMTSKQFENKEYDMKHPQAGRAIIVNNKTFQGRRRKGDQKIRKDSDRDRDGICEVLQKLGFKGIRYNNTKTNQVEERMMFEDVQKEHLIQLLKDAGNDDLNDYTNMDCFICVILSYGEPGAIYCPGGSNSNQTDDIVELKKLQDPLKGNRCRTLVMKPKLFFIQGCPYLEKDIADAKGKADVAVTVTKKIPIEADFLTQSCHLRGSYGWDNKGMSWFIRALSKALQKFCIDDVKTSPEKRSIHFMTVLTRVNRFVAEYMDKEGGITPDSTFQIPLVTSLLTKHLYFYDKSNSV